MSYNMALVGLSEIRRRKGLSQAQLAQMIGRDRSAVANYETRTMPPWPTLLKLSRALGYPSVERFVRKATQQRSDQRAA